MMDTDVALEALNVLCSAGVAAAKRAGSVTAPTGYISEGAAQLQLPMRELSIKDLTPLVLCGHHSSINVCPGSVPGLTSFINLPQDISQDEKTGEIEINPDPLWSEIHLDPRFNYDFTKLNDSKTFYRGGEKYQRPCGWQRFALKVLDEYEDNTWLGNNWRSTESVSGEWPVSYHGTRQESVKPIIDDNYKAGNRQLYGRGIYSTPDIDEAERNYAIEFTSKKTSKKFKAVMQNRINPERRTICDYKDYWLVEVPKGATPEEEREIVEKAIRPYGLLLKEIR